MKDVRSVSIFQHHLLKKLSLLHCIAFAPLAKITWLYLWGSFSGLSILFHWSVCSCVHHTVFVTVALLEVWYCQFSNFVLPLQYYIGYSGSFASPFNFSISFMSFFPLCKLFISFSCLSVLARITSMMLKRSCGKRHPCLLPDFSGKALSFSLLNMLTVGYL